MLPDGGFTELLVVLAIGLAAGLLGGLLGIGGSLIIIPAITLLLGPNQHLYQAAAMIVNVVVAASATLRHLRGKVIRQDIAARMLPTALVSIAVGVAVSNRFDSRALAQVFGLFLLYFAVWEALHFLRRGSDVEPKPERTGWTVCSITGCVMGFLAGLLGIGAGAVTVPLLRRLGRVPLREAIGTTSAVMLVTSTIGALHKNATLAEHAGPDGDPLQWQESIGLAAMLTPMAILGALLGAHLVYRLPVNAIRAALVLLMTGAAARMLGLWG